MPSEIERRVRPACWPGWPLRIQTRTAERNCPMSIIDSQGHAYEANTPKRPWNTVPDWADPGTGDEMVAAMDRVGVDGAIFISAFSMYRYDASYAVQVQRAHPGRFAIVKPVNPDDPGLDRICRAAVKHDLPVNMLFWGNLDAGTAVIDRHRDTRFIVDHL